MLIDFKIRGPFKELEDGRIDCEISFVEPNPMASLGWMPYTADPEDEHLGGLGARVHSKAKKMKSLVKHKPPTDAELLVKKKEEVAARVKVLLSESDWSQLDDIDPETKEVYKLYRSELRAVKYQKGYPFEVEWPTKPE